MKPIVSGVIGAAIALILLPIVVLLYLRFGSPPVAVRDKPFPFEKQIVKIPLHARFNRDEPKFCPLPVNDANLIAGAQIYKMKCAVCHGFKKVQSGIGPNMYPPAPNLWRKHGRDRVGVSHNPVGETFWKVDNGIRLTGMPSFSTLLTEAQMWQVSMLLANANKPLPPEADQLVTQPKMASKTQTTPQNSKGSHRALGPAVTKQHGK
jgi:mono/diheme cytochrome c family protein